MFNIGRHGGSAALPRLSGGTAAFGRHGGSAALPRLGRHGGFRAARAALRLCRGSGGTGGHVFRIPFQPGPWVTGPARTRPGSGPEFFDFFFRPVSTVSRTLEFFSAHFSFLGIFFIKIYNFPSFPTCGIVLLHFHQFSINFL